MVSKQEIHESKCMSHGDQASPFAHRAPHPRVNNLLGSSMISRITCVLNDVFFPVTDI